MRKNIFSLIIISIILLDQLTKLLIRNLLSINTSINLINNFLKITHTTNTGAVFGILQGQNTLLLFFSIIILGIILFYYDKLPKSYSLALIIAGIIGNLIDRIFFGRVTDFISFSFWPAFNIADSALTIGTLWLMIILLRSK